MNAWIRHSAVQKIQRTYEWVFGRFSGDSARLESEAEAMLRDSTISIYNFLIELVFISYSVWFDENSLFFLSTNQLHVYLNQSSGSNPLFSFYPSLPKSDFGSNPSVPAFPGILAFDD